MKRNSLTTAVVAGIAGVAGFAGLANAVDLNPDGLGQVLIYPYYTVNKAQDTLISVVNTADVGKAVKVRFLEGYNSREVLDFNLYLSPHDVWVAGITAADRNDDSSGGTLKTNDHSCVDFLPSNPYPFLTYGFDGQSPGQGADAGPTTVDRTREGYVEMISMGDIIPGSATAQAITHTASSAPDAATPADCGFLSGNTAGVSADLVPPTGGLFGAGVIINVDQGTFFGYNADAIDGFTESVVFTDPGSLQPTLQQASNPSVATNGIARAFVFEQGGALLIADYLRGQDAVSAVFMSDSIYNEYLRDSSLGATSDWVITFPTKRFYVDKVLYPSTITAPFVAPFDAPGVSNVTADFQAYDREEQFSTLPGCPSPQGPNCFASNPVLHYEVNVLTFTDAQVDESQVFGSRLFSYTTPFGLDGWAKINLATGDGGHVLTGGVTPAGAAVNLSGLPVTGFYGYNIINSQLTSVDGDLVKANYGGLFRHRAHRSCTGQDPACS